MTSYFDAAALIEEISKKYNFDTETGQIEKVTADMSSFRLKILLAEDSAQETAKSPQTADTAPIMMIVLVMASALGMIMVLTGKRA